MENISILLRALDVIVCLGFAIMFCILWQDNANDNKKCYIITAIVIFFGPLLGIYWALHNEMTYVELLGTILKLLIYVCGISGFFYGGYILVKKFTKRDPFKSQEGKLILECQKCYEQVINILENTFISNLYDFESRQFDGPPLDLKSVIYLFVEEELKSLRTNTAINPGEFKRMFTTYFSDYMTSDILMSNIECYQNALNKDYCNNEFSCFQQSGLKNDISFNMIAAFADYLVNPSVKRYLNSEISAFDVEHCPLHNNEGVFYSKVIHTKIFPIFEALKRKIYLYANKLD